MKQFTLLWIEIEELKLVAFKSFVDFNSLIEFKNKKFKDLRLNRVDKEGYVWFCE